MNKILIIGDPHFKVNNIPESKQFIQRISTLLKSRDDIACCIVMGDVLDTHEKLNTFALNIALQFFEECRKIVPVYCLVGNHDATSNTIFLTDSHWMNVLKSTVKVIDKPELLIVNEFKAVMCPYVPDGRFIEALNTIGMEWMEADLILAHQLLDGAKMGPIVAKGVEKWQNNYPMCISGHIHDKQRVQDNLYYLGSSMQHAFGEAADKTVCLYDVETGVWDDIDLHLPKKEIIYVTPDTLEKVHEKIMKNENGSTMYKVVMKGEKDEIKIAKNTKLFKEISTSKIVKSTHIKENLEHAHDDVVTSERKTDSFEETLREMISRHSDNFLNSLMEHLLIGAEDFSDKEVFFI